MDKPPPIRLNRVSLTGAELANLEAALAGGHTGGDGPFTHRCEALLEGILGGGRVLLTTSGTHALELAARGVEAAVHHQPLHLSPAGRRLGGRPGDCPVTEDVCRRLLRLPLHAELGAEGVERVVTALVASW